MPIPARSEALPASSEALPTGSEALRLSFETGIAPQKAAAQILLHQQSNIDYFNETSETKETADPVTILQLFIFDFDYFSTLKTSWGLERD